MKLSVNLKESYDVIIENGILDKAKKYFNLNRKVLIVTDNGVPDQYALKIKNQCQDGYIFTIKQGEENKTLDTYTQLLTFMSKHQFTRTDCVVAVGGGLVGDLAGFVAASYMRGVDFYNCPTTILSMVDSSIGGKTAVNLLNVKNIVGAFYQPKCVLVDILTLMSLPTRLCNEGLVEAFKMGVTNDKSLVDLLLNTNDIQSDINTVIYKALCVKKAIVEKDEKESNERKFLNYGHTIGHAIEANCNGKLYHGECVAIGMNYFSSDTVKPYINKFISKFNLPNKSPYSLDELLKFIRIDKKSSGDSITVVYVDEIEKPRLVKVKIDDLISKIEGGTL